MLRCNAHTTKRSFNFQGFQYSEFYISKINNKIRHKSMVSISMTLRCLCFVTDFFDSMSISMFKKQNFKFDSINLNLIEYFYNLIITSLRTLASGRPASTPITPRSKIDMIMGKHWHPVKVTPKKKKNRKKLSQAKIVMCCACITLLCMNEQYWHVIRTKIFLQNKV